MVSTSQHTEAGSVVEMASLVSRVAQLEAENAQLRDALTRRQQIGVATGLLAQRFAVSPERAWSLLVRLSQNSHVKVREIAQAVIDVHCGRRDLVNCEILSSIEKHLPDGVRLVETEGDGHRPVRENPR
ncbi:MAG TPA: ANTAR domain-containing protein [Propionibacteriaceae bacterium]|nr:ANTAR domain-containing protein [Propionibacteriaceae bacterium]